MREESYRDRPFDAEAQREASKDLLAPEGTYTTVPPLRVEEITGQQGPDTGRAMYSFYGEMRLEKEVHNAATGETKLVTLTTKQSFKLAAKRRDGAGPQEPKYRMWTQAAKLFKTTEGRNPSTEGELTDYIANNPVRVQLAHFTPEDGDARVYFKNLYGVRRG